MSELLNEITVAPYLQKRGIIGDQFEVEVLTGGVSNVVLAIKTPDKNLVLKQALPQLKVAQEWKADQRRAIVEAEAMRLFHGLTPLAVPKIVDNDPVEFTLTMERLPNDFVNWKEEMLVGRANPKVGTNLGEILANWHNFGAINIEVRNQFMEDSLFEQLRINPFYRAVQKVNPDLKIIAELIKENENEKITLVHGDFSPKNILINSDGDVVVLDFEVEHTGNPVFDLAFVTAHLVCKYIHTKNEDISTSAHNFFVAYKQHAKLPVSYSVAHHIALIALARIEGVSPVNYLSTESKEKVVKLTKKILRKESAEVRDFFN